MLHRLERSGADIDLRPALALLAAIIGALVVYDGESTWYEGGVLVGLYVVIAASFWWGT